MDTDPDYTIAYRAANGDILGYSYRYPRADGHTYTRYYSYRNDTLHLDADTADPDFYAEWNGPPFAGAPLCPSHDPQMWHGLWDSARGCHYDHTHNADPNDPKITAIFGAAASAWGGNTISYPWATSASENTMKHGGYKYATRLGIPCDTVTDFVGYSPIDCVTAARIEYHGVGSSIDMLARYHSFYAEFNVCAYPAFTQCGIVRQGGWMDLGILTLPYPVIPANHVKRPGGTVDFGMGSKYGGGDMEAIMTLAADPPLLDQFVNVHDPYIAGLPFDGTAPGTNWDVSQRYKDKNVSSWAMGQFVGVTKDNPYLGFLFNIRDTFDLLDKANPNVDYWVCSKDPNFHVAPGQKPPTNCNYNGSVHSVNEFQFRTVNMFTHNVLPEFANSVSTLNGIQVVNYRGYTDRYGKVVQGCSAIGLDCVPLSIENVPLGVARSEDVGAGNNANVEFDNSPAGVKWIEWPN